MEPYTIWSALVYFDVVEADLPKLQDQRVYPPIQPHDSVWVKCRGRGRGRQFKEEAKIKMRECYGLRVNPTDVGLTSSTRYNS